MGAAGTKTVTIERYLANPAYQHCEYVDGDVVERNVGTNKHARITGKCYRKLDEYLDTHPVGSVYVELHCRLSIGGRPRFRLPDAALVLGQFDEDYLDRAPDLAVEVRSPDDTISGQIAKFNDYFANGCRLGWLVLPEERSVLILTPGASPIPAREGDILDGGDLLPGLQIPVAALFA